MASGALPSASTTSSFGGCTASESRAGVPSPAISLTLALVSCAPSSSPPSAFFSASGLSRLVGDNTSTAFSSCHPGGACQSVSPVFEFCQKYFFFPLWYSFTHSFALPLAVSLALASVSCALSSSPRSACFSAPSLSAFVSGSASRDVCIHARAECPLRAPFVCSLNNDTELQTQTHKAYH